MYDGVREALLENPQNIVTILERFGFSNITLKPKEIRCARQEGSNATSVCIRLQDNQYLFVTDFAHGESLGLFSYIEREKGIPYKEILAFAKEITGIYHSGYSYESRPKPIYNEEQKENIVIEEQELDRYKKIFSLRFLKDNISLSSQNYFDIRYDSESDRIIIPVKDPYGQLIGIKGRTNYDSDDDPKYLYIISCIPSLTLFGYSANKMSSYQGDVLICESEKSVMQAYGYNYFNAFGIAGNKLSKTQIDLIADLDPARVVLALDKSLGQKEIDVNLNLLTQRLDILGTEIWQWIPGDDIPEKACITDMGERVFYRELSNQIVRV